MSGDIEDFLRRAAERRKQQGGGPPPPLPQRLAPVMDAEILEAVPVYGTGVADEVARHLDNREFAQRSAHLGEGIRAETQNIDSRVQSDLSRRAQPLQDRTAAATDKTTDVAAVVTTAAENTMAKELLATLSNPNSLRQAIVLSEVFSRPEHRW